MTTFTIEKFEDNIEDLKKLAIMLNEEAGVYSDIPMDVNWETYLKSEKNGVLKFYAVRESEKLVGFAYFSVGHPIDFSSSLQASLSNLFIHPDHRGQGAEFISWCDKQLKELGVQVVFYHVKVKNDYGKLLKRLGYEKINIEYCKRLDKD